MKKFIENIGRNFRRHEQISMMNARVIGYNTKSKIVYWICVLWHEAAFQRCKLWTKLFHLTLDVLN